MNGIFISNDINCPCNIKKCTSETIQSCYGCPEWFAWLYDIEQSDKRNPKQVYVGKHYLEGKDMRDFNIVKSDLIRKLSLSCQKTDGEILWYEGALDVLIEFLSILFFIPKWIPVTERLPPAEKEVYVTDGEYIARANLLDEVFHSDKPCWSYSGLGEITHWCEQIPLPQPLKEERVWQKNL